MVSIKNCNFAAYRDPYFVLTEQSKQTICVQGYAIFIALKANVVAT